MKVLDSHIHISRGEPNPERLRQRMREAGVDGGVIISHSPEAYSALGAPKPPAWRLDNLFEWMAGMAGYFPFFWIDPREDDALEQVAKAVERGVAGFKVICSAFDPGDPRAMPVYRAIAKAGKPMLFHSGILWDGTPSSMHCRPVLFEALLEVPGLRFALAHISWPWVDECIAVYGKFLNARHRRPEVTSEMFIDLTPGTPRSYRREALTKLLTVGYNLEHDLLFGTDCGTQEYSIDHARDWIARDTEIYQSLGIADTTVEDIFRNNLLRFIGGG